MTRRLVYGGALVAFLGGKCLDSQHARRDLFTDLLIAFALSLASILIPRWISWDSETVRPLSSPIPSLKGPSLTPSLLAQRRKDTLHLWPSSPLFFSHQNLRLLSPPRRLSWRPVFLLHVALRRFPRLICHRHRGHDPYYVYCHPGRRETKEGIWMEDTSWTAFFLRGCGVRWDGDNSECPRQGSKSGTR